MHILNRVVLILISVAPTFAGAVSLPSDVLPVVQKRIMFKAAEKTACVTLFPELAGVIDDAWKNWPASRIKIQLLINGKEWIDPPLRSFYEDELVNMKKMSKEKAKEKCKRFPESLSTALEPTDYDVFIKPLFEFGTGEIQIK